MAQPDDPRHHNRLGMQALAERRLTEAAAAFARAAELEAEVGGEAHARFNEEATEKKASYLEMKKERRRAKRGAIFMKLRSLGGSAS